MKKLLKWSAIIAGSILVLMIIAVLALPFFLPLDKIKDMAAQKLSESLHRQVKIEKVSLNLFEGIKLEKLSVSNHPSFSRQDFVSADAIVLKYAFWPIFRRQIIVKELVLVRPGVLIEKSSSGELNFSDLTKKPDQKNKTADTEKKNQNFQLLVDSFVIKDGKIVYLDKGASTQSEIKSLNLKASGFALSFARPIKLKASAIAIYQGKEIPLSLTSDIAYDLWANKISAPNLNLGIADQKANIALIIDDLTDVDVSISTKKLAIDPLLLLFSPGTSQPKKKAVKGELTRNINRLAASIPAKYNINCKLDLENIGLLGFSVDKIKSDLALKNKQLTINAGDIKLYKGVLSGKANVNLSVPGLAYSLTGLKLTGFDAAAFSNDIVDGFLTKLDGYQDLKNKLYGQLNADLSLSGRGVETDDILNNLNASGSFSVPGGELKRVKTLAEIGKTIKSNSLQADLNFTDLGAGFVFKNKVLSLKDLRLMAGDIKVKFNGGLDLNKLVWVPGNVLSLRLSPAATKNLAKEFDVFRDQQGWFNLDFEITGSLKLPVPKPILNKPIEAAIGKIKVEIEAKKVEIINQAQEQLKQEASKKLKELIKF